MQELSTRDASHYASLSQGHIMRLVRSGEIAARKVETPGGYYWLINQASLDAYLAKPRKPGPPVGSQDTWKRKKPAEPRTEGRAAA